MQNAVAENMSVEQETIKVCTFRLSGRLFGIDIVDVKEINTETGFTPIFHAPKEVLGYVNIRGQIYLVLDLRLLMGFERNEINSKNRLVIFKDNVAEPFGVCVDSIGDIIEVDSKQIEGYDPQNEPSRVTSEEQNIKSFAKGVCRLEKELLVLLGARDILRAIEK